MGAAEIRALFPGRRIELRRVTLAPPLARLVVPVSWKPLAACPSSVIAATLPEALEWLWQGYPK